MADVALNGSQRRCLVRMVAERWVVLATRAVMPDGERFRGPKANWRKLAREEDHERALLEGIYFALTGRDVPAIERDVFVEFYPKGSYLGTTGEGEKLYSKADWERVRHGELREYRRKLVEAMTSETA